MGETRHEKHVFTNKYLKRIRRFRSGVNLVLILLIALIPLFHSPNFTLEYKDKWAITIALLAVIVSLSISMTNLHFKNKQLQTSSLFKVFELLSSPEIRDSRKRVHDAYHSLKDNPPILFTNTDFEKDVDIVLSSFDQVSATVLNELLDKELFFDTYSEMIVRDWNTLKDEIKLRQSKNQKTLRHFTTLKIEFEEMLKRDPKYQDSDIEPY